jgi:membrane protease YdiL (CAAX protease family)
MKLFLKYRWLISLIIALIVSSLFSLGKSFQTFGLLTLLFFIFALLFFYQKSRWLAFFALSLLPTFTVQLIAQLNHQKTFDLTATLTFFIIFVVALITSYFLARRYEMIPPFSLKSFPWGKIVIGWLILMAVSMAVNLIFQPNVTTENQSAIDSLQKIIPVSVFAFMTIFAGFFEELTYRVGAFEIIFKEHPRLAYILAVFLFAFMHDPTDLYSWILYGAMSLVLTTFYWKYRNFYLNMSIHMAWNGFAVLAALFIK